MSIRTTASALALTVVVPLAAAAPPDPEPAAAPPEPDERITVTATRLPDVVEDFDRIPASVTVLTSEDIARSGAADLADLLALQTGAVVYDQTGNGVQTTFDMRGFTDGSGTRVYLDGAPLNDAVNNSLALELVPLEALDRVEITRGSSAALAGGGAEAGVLNLVTRSPRELGGAFHVAGGTFETSDLDGHVAHDTGKVDFWLSGTRRDTDGFRTNGGGDLTRLAGSIGIDLAEERRLRLTVIRSAGDYGNPGALTREELEADRSAAPYNALDFADERLGLATLDFRSPVGRSLTLAANVFARERETESLTTGRAAPFFGGFALDSDASFVGSTVQMTHRHESGDSINVLAFGGEWLDGDTGARGYATPWDDPGAVPPTPSTDTTSDRTTAALFVQDTWTPSERWTLSAGARYDRDRVALDETLPDPANDDSRRFNELSLRGGATWSPDGRHALFASYGEGFLPPTSEQLFAFPGFGSDRDLEPEDSRSYEVGFRGHWRGAVRAEAALFRIDTHDEIVFDPTPSAEHPFGANVNAGETRRQGIEIAVRGRASRVVTFFANLTLTHAEFTAGASDGNDVPLVPGQRLALGVEAALPGGVSLATDALHVGEQVLDNDVENSQPELDRYVVVNARVRWRPAGVTSRERGPELFAEVRNLLDEEYETRGIYAFDFQTGMNDRFFTPAPGRRYRVGVGWTF